MANVILSEEEYNELKKSRDSWRDRYYEIRYALRKDEQLDESISSTDIPSDVEMIEDLKKRAADSDYYKEKSELLDERNNNQFDTIREKDKKIDHLLSENKELDEKLKKANELAESWKRDYERIREQFLCPIYNILYPDNPNLDINVTDLLNTIKDFKVYADENGRMYEEIKKYRDDISKIQNIVTEKDVEIKGLKKEIINLGFDRATAKDIMKKNIKLNQTTSDQEVTIKALLITIKEMCKEDETNA
jgi:hypothetical protein